MKLPDREFLKANWEKLFRREDISAKSGWRNERKRFLTFENYVQIRTRLRQVASPDPYVNADGTYRVRSLYFDDWEDSALAEKLDGRDPREKFRIRMYDGKTATLHLEKKCRIGARSRKYSEALTLEQVRELLNGDTDWVDRAADAAFASAEPSVILELHYKMRCHGLRPREVVEYVREPYVYEPGNVRVTFDYDLRRSSNPWDLLGTGQVLPFPAGSAPMLMEVKWSQFLPSFIQDALGSPGSFTAFSKYAHCRLRF